MSEEKNKSKIFIIVISAIVVALIVIGLILTWKIIQKGQESSLSHSEVEQVHIDSYTSHDACNQQVKYDRHIF